MEVKSKKAQLLEESCGVCVYCGHKLDLNTMEIEHIMPLAKGGSDLFENNVCSCHECNSQKKDMLPQEFHALMSEKRQKAFRNRLTHLVDSGHMTPAKLQLLLSGKSDVHDSNTNCNDIKIELGHVAGRRIILSLSLDIV